MKVPKHLKKRRAKRYTILNAEQERIQAILDKIANHKGCSWEEWKSVEHLFPSNIDTPQKIACPLSY